MADVCDQAADHMEAELAQRAAYHARKAKERELTPNGVCHNPDCQLEFDEEFVGSEASLKLFCDAKCAADYERLKSRRG